MTLPTSPDFREIVAFGRRATLFCVLLAVTHAAVVAVAIRLIPAATLSSFTNIPRLGAVGQARLMIEEADQASDLDILFIGSSHAYQSFDPRFFERHGLHVFTLGSAGLSPAQGYHLQRRYLPSMRPRLIVYEVWWNSLGGDGAEATLNLIANLPWSMDLLRMTIETRNIVVYGGLLRRAFGGPAADPEKRLPVVLTGRYIGSGYVEASGVFTGSFTMPPWSITLQPRQLAYLGRMIDGARAAGARVALVVQPIPNEFLGRLRNHAEVDSAMGRFAAAYNVPYLDFNRLMQLDTRVHYADSNHLNDAGVEAFLERLMIELRRLQLVDD